MVIEDLSNYPNKNTKNTNQHEILAPSSDRLIANFFDALLHFPIFAVIISSYLYKLHLLHWVSESQSETFYVILQTILIVFLSVLSLQSIYIKILHFTPGMYFLKLRVKSFNSEDITWGQAFLRSLFWIFSIVLIGLPFLEIFSHQRKRLLHDRVSETEVYTLKNKFFEAKPLPVEASAVRMFLIALGFAVLGWLSAFLSWSQKQIEAGHLAMSEYTERGMLCEELDDLSSRSHIDIKSSEKRLDYAMTLFILGQLDQKCLAKETDFAFLKGYENNNKFWSRALIAAPFSEDRQSYLDKACKENKVWCETDFLLNSKTKDSTKLLLTQANDNWDQKPWAYQASLIKLYNNLGQTDQVLKLIQNLQTQGIQSTGLIYEQLRSLVRSNRNSEVKEVLRGVRSIVMEKDFARVNSQLCMQTLDSGCSVPNDFCPQFNELVDKNKDLLTELSIGRSYFKLKFCKNELVENLETWSLVEDVDLQELIQWSIYTQEPNSKMEGLVHLRTFVQDNSKPIELRWDALQILLSKTNYNKDWQLVSSFWKEFTPYSESYLSASHWIINEAKLQNSKNLISQIEQSVQFIPGFELDKTHSPTEKYKNRLPANSDHHEFKRSK